MRVKTLCGIDVTLTLYVRLEYCWCVRRLSLIELEKHGQGCSCYRTNGLGGDLVFARFRFSGQKLTLTTTTKTIGMGGADCFVLMHAS